MARKTRSSIPDRVIPKTQKMLLDASLLKTQRYKEWIKGKVAQSKEKSRAPPHPSVTYQMKKRPSGCPRRKSPTMLIYIYTERERERERERRFHRTEYIAMNLSCFLSLSLSLYIYIYIYIYVCVCVCMYINRCVCVCVSTDVY